MWNDYAIARALHVLAIVMWVGGVGFVTTVLIPAIGRRFAPDLQYAMFEDVEHRFGAQARLWVLLALASGAWMLHASDGWARLLDTGWLQLMLAAWLPFLLMLFVLEPFFIHRWLKRRAQHDPAGTMRLLQRLHVVLLALTLSALLAGVVGAHGGWRF